MNQFDRLARKGKLYKTEEGHWLAMFNDEKGFNTLPLHPFQEFDFELEVGMEFYFGVEYLMNNPIHPVAYIPF
jgi:hypothetical protein